MAAHDRLRDLGALERFMIARSNLGIYYKVGLTVRYSRKGNQDLKSALFGALALVIPQYPNLSSVVANTDTPNPYFVRLPQIDLEKAVVFVDDTSNNTSMVGSWSATLDQFIQDQHNHPFEHTISDVPLWRLFVFQEPGNALHFTLSLFFHHCIGDTKSAVVFHEALEKALNRNTSPSSDSIIETSKSPLLPPLEDFMEHLVAPNSAPTQQHLSNGWTGAPQFLPVNGRFQSHCLSAESTKELLDTTKRLQVSLTAILQTTIVAALFRILPEEFDTVKVDCPMSLRPFLPFPIDLSSMGCIGDGFSTSYRRGPLDVEEIHRTQRTIKRVVQQKGEQNVCWQLSQIESLQEWLLSKMGQPRPSAIELSNIGKLAPSTESGEYEIETMLFSQSAGATSGAIKVSVATGRDNRLTMGFSWQEGVIDEDVIPSLISEFDLVLADALRMQCK